MAQPIPGWPVFQSLWSPVSHIGYGSSTFSYEEASFIDVTGREMRQWSIGRGRQFELDQNQTGTLSTTWDDRDGAFDPLHAASPYAGCIEPYQPYRLQARSPGSINLLTTDQAEAGQGTGFPAGTNPRTWGVYNNSGPTLATVASAFAMVGSLVYQTAFVGTETAFSNIIRIPFGIPVVPLTSYAWSVWVAVSSGTSVPVEVVIKWVDGTGATISFSTATIVAPGPVSGGWAKASVAAQAPAGAVTAIPYAEINVNLSAPVAFQVAALQWEQSTVAHAFAAPGVAPTNLLSVDKATAGLGTPWPAGSPMDAFGIDGGGGWGWNGEWQTVVPSVTPASGASAYETGVTSAVAFTTAAEATETAPLIFFTYVPVTPGQAYSYQAQMRCVTSGQAPSMMAILDFRGMPFSPGTAVPSTSLSIVTGTPATLTGATGAAFTTLTVSGTAPANASYAIIALAPSAAISALSVLQSASWQFEPNAAPSTYGTPPPWYPLITGGVERYPGQSEYVGLLNERIPTIVDAFALLSQSQLLDPFSAAVMTPQGGSAPTFFYTLGDPSNATSFADSTGNRSPMVVWNSKNGAGTVTPGTAQTSASPSGGFLGAPGATVTNFTSSAAAGVASYGPAMSWLEVPPSAAGIRGPAAGTAIGFTRMIAYRCTATPANSSALWWAEDLTQTYNVGLMITSGLGVALAVTDQHNTGTLTFGSTDLNNWHLAWIGTAADGNSFICGVDGTISSFATTATINMQAPFVSDRIAGAGVANNMATGIANFKGDIGFVCEWPFEMSSAQVAAVYQGWRTAWSGDSSGQRYQRILQLAGWTGPALIDAGVSSNLGPATTISGQDALSALQDVVNTELGNHYVRADGTIVFRARSHRWGVNTPAVTFGGNLGEIAYEGDATTDLDPTHVCNLAQVTQATTTGQVFSATAPAGSSSQYGTRPMQISSLSADSAECLAQAQYLVSRYQSALVRYSNLAVNPATLPAAWPTVLGIDLDTRVRVMNRPPAGYVTTYDGWIENIAWSADESGAAKVQYQVSPIDPSPYILFQALHTTVHTAASSGATTLTLDALADASTSQAECSFYVGQVLTINPGLPAAQNVTVTKVPTTVVGYSTFTITVTALTGSVTATAVICEQLPASTTTFVYSGGSYALAGPTDPTTWDLHATPYGVMDTGVFAY